MLIMTGAKPLQTSRFEKSFFIVKADPEAVEEIDTSQQIESYTEALRKSDNRYKFMSGKADRQFMQVNRYLLSVTHTKPYFSSLSIYKPQNTGYVCMKNSTGCAGINIGINGNPSSIIPFQISRFMIGPK